MARLHMQAGYFGILRKSEREEKTRRIEFTKEVGHGGFSVSVRRGGFYSVVIGFKWGRIIRLFDFVR